MDNNILYHFTENQTESGIEMKMTTAKQVGGGGATKIQFTANGIDNVFDTMSDEVIKAVFWNGALLNDSDWSQTDNLLTLQFTPNLNDLIKPI